MDTEVIRIDDQPAEPAVRRAVEVLDRGGLVVFPTETVYGVGARADRPDGLARLRDFKSRGAEQAFTVHVGSCDHAWRLVAKRSYLAERLARKGWPGPMTLILPVADPKQAPVASGLGGEALDAMYHNGTVGIRYPDHPIACALLAGAGGPVVATSANRSGAPPARDGAAAMAALDGRVELVLDGGQARYAQASTIVRVSDEGCEILRGGVLDSGAVSLMSLYRIVFVCTGNTCRSPMAEGLAKQALAERLGCRVEDLADHGMIVESAGVAGGYGSASAHAVEVMRARGIDIGAHRSRLLTDELVRQADIVVAMTEGHARAACALVSGCDRVRLLLGHADVGDPIGGTIDDYQQCADAIGAGIVELLKEVPV